MKQLSRKLFQDWPSSDSGNAPMLLSGALVKAGALMYSQEATKKSSVVSLTSGSNDLEESSSRWLWVRGNIKLIRDYGRKEGILEAAGPVANAALVEAKAANGGDKPIHETKNAIDIPVNDMLVMHQAIPWLPLPAAIICLICNILLAGSGTMLSGLFVLCMGAPRLQVKDCRVLSSCLINLIVGIFQLCTITFMLVGWFWSIAWGFIILIHSMQYTAELVQKRQTQVATAALEALTKDTLLRRKEVNELVREGKGQGEKAKAPDIKTKRQLSKKSKSQAPTADIPENALDYGTWLEKGVCPIGDPEANPELPNQTSVDEGGSDGDSGMISPVVTSKSPRRNGDLPTDAEVVDGPKRSLTSDGGFFRKLSFRK